MKKKFFHGSSTYITDPLWKGTCVTNAKPNALIFALRRRKDECYIYTLMLDPSTDLQPDVDSVGTLDYVLIRPTPFYDRELVTDEVEAECRAAIKSEIDALP